jgi:hypothetical protein
MATWYVYSPTGEGALNGTLGNAWAEMSDIAGIAAGDTVKLAGTSTRTAAMGTVTFATDGTAGNIIKYLGCDYATWTPGAAQYTIQGNAASKPDRLFTISAREFINIRYVNLDGTNITDSCIYVASGDYAMWLDHCLLKNAPNYGIRIAAGYFSGEITFCVFMGSYTGFYYSGSNEPLFVGFSKFLNHTKQGFQSNGKVTLYRNIFHNNGDDDYANSGQPNYVIGNTFDGNTTGSAIKTTASYDFSSVLNRFTNANQYGLECTAANGNLSLFDCFNNNAVGEATNMTLNSSISMAGTGYTAIGSNDFTLTSTAEGRAIVRAMDWDLVTPYNNTYETAGLSPAAGSQTYPIFGNFVSR